MGLPHMGGVAIHQGGVTMPSGIALLLRTGGEANTAQLIQSCLLSMGFIHVLWSRNGYHKTTKMRNC